jgi:hypothetical protein
MNVSRHCSSDKTPTDIAICKIYHFERKKVYCILASCYIRLTLDICSFVHQCNTFTSYILLIDMFRPHTAIFRCYSILSRSWCTSLKKKRPKLSTFGTYRVNVKNVKDFFFSVMIFCFAGFDSSQRLGIWALLWRFHHWRSACPDCSSLYGQVRYSQ